AGGIRGGDQQEVVGQLRPERGQQGLVAGVVLAEGPDEQRGRHVTLLRRRASGQVRSEAYRSRWRAATSGHHRPSASSPDVAASWSRRRGSAARRRSTAASAAGSRGAVRAGGAAVAATSAGDNSTGVRWASARARAPLA